MIQDPVLVFAYLAAVVALVFQVARRPALRPLFDRLPALVWTYFLPMLSTTAGILPAESPVYRAIARYLLPASLSLLLLSSEIKAIARLGRTALVVMTAGMAGIMLGGIGGFLVLRPWLPPEAWKAVGASACRRRKRGAHLRHPPWRGPPCSSGRTILAAPRTR